MKRRPSFAATAGSFAVLSLTACQIEPPEFSDTPAQGSDNPLQADASATLDGGALDAPADAAGLHPNNAALSAQPIDAGASTNPHHVPGRPDASLMAPNDGTSTVDNQSEEPTPSGPASTGLEPTTQEPSPEPNVVDPEPVSEPSPEPNVVDPNPEPASEPSPEPNVVDPNPEPTDAVPEPEPSESHSPECGNGILESPELCDDGNPEAGDGCSNCTVDPTWNCSGTPSLCVPPPAPVIDGFAVSTEKLPGGGGDVTLSWSVTGASSVHLYVNGQDEGALTGSPVTRTVSQSTTFTLVAENAGGRVERSRTVVATAEGSLSWTDTFGPTGTRVNGITTDGSGNVIAVGTTRGKLAIESLGDSDAFIRKYSSAGTVLWTRQWGTSSGDQANAVSVAADGSILVAGTTHGALPSQSSQGYDDAFLAKYTIDGDLVWQRQFGGQGGDTGLVLAGGSAGQLYIAGECSTHKCVTRYSAEGVKEWTSDLGTPVSWSSGGGIGVNETDEVFVAGFQAARGDVGSAFLGKVSATGDPQWLLSPGPEQSPPYYPRTLALDPEDNVLLVGLTYGGLFDSYGGGQDVVVTQLSPAGELIQGIQFGGEGDDLPDALCVDPHGHVVIVGKTTGLITPSDSNAPTFVYRTSFSPEVTPWVRQLGDASSDTLTSCAFGPDGSLYVGGWHSTGTGNQGWVLGFR